MAEFNFKYGNGKTVELCQTAYNYQERNGRVVIINANNNEPIVSKLQDYYGTKLGANVTDKLDNELLFTKGFKFKNDEIDVILVDNAHLLSVSEVEQLYFIAKLLGIKVISYGNRANNNQRSLGSIRLMELANNITKVDGDHNNSINSKLQFYYGTMNCCKTAKLLIEAKNLENMKKRVCLIKPKLDRDEKMVKSRVGLGRVADIVIDKNNILNVDMIKHFDVILVDEAQFLTETQIDSLYQINKNYHIPIKCYGLKSDFRTYTFPGSKRLLEIADELIKLHTVCHCHGKPDASFNARKVINGDYIREGEQEVIDNGEKIEYISLCDICYIKDVWQIDINEPKKLIKKFI